MTFSSALVVIVHRKVTRSRTRIYEEMSLENVTAVAVVVVENVEWADVDQITREVRPKDHLTWRNVEYREDRFHAAIGWSGCCMGATERFPSDCRSM
jgi:hypothetical protein